MKRLISFLKSPLVKWAYFLLLLGAATYYLLGWGGQLEAVLSRARWEPLLGALLLCLSTVLLNAYIYYTIYRGTGIRLSYWKVFRIITVSQLGKYIPGKVVFAGNYYLLSREAGVDDGRIGVTFIVSVSLWILSACLCSLPALALVAPPLRYSVILLPFLLVVLIHPRVLTWALGLIRKGLGRVGWGLREASPITLSYGLYAKGLILYLVAWALTGAQIYLILKAFQPISLAVYPLALSAGALATVVGFVALFAPAGLGVREGVGALILASAVSMETAFIAMVAFRVLATSTDLSLAGAARILLRPQGASEEA